MNEESLRGDEEMDFELYNEHTGDGGQTASFKYSKLLRKCEQIKMENFRLINYIDQINKLVRKVRKQNAFICNKLDQNNDEYHKVKPSILQEIESVITYGKNKLNSSNAVDNSLSEEGDYDLTIDHRNKRIKTEVDSNDNQTSNLSSRQSDD